MPTDTICYTDTSTGRIVYRWDREMQAWIWFAFVAFAV